MIYHGSSYTLVTLGVYLDEFDVTKTSAIEETILASIIM